MEYVEEKRTAGLTSAELSNIWSAYMENSMTAAMFQYFHGVAEDEGIKKIAGGILNNSKSNIESLKKFFIEEDIQIPQGFNNEDVKTEVPKLYSDTLILCFCDEIAKLRLYVYPSALSDSSRKDVRDFFCDNIDVSKSIQNDLVDLMLSKGIYIRPPQVAVEKQVDFVEKKSYLKGLLGNVRPLNVAEITSINRLLQRAVISKVLLISFAQIASDEDVFKYFLKGKELAQSITDEVRGILEGEDLPAPAHWDYKLSESSASPFPDRLMLLFLLTCTGVLCFSNASQGITASLRTDVSAKFAGFVASMASYFGDGIKLMIDKGYFERPLQIIDRDKMRRARKD